MGGEIYKFVNFLVGCILNLDYIPNFSSLALQELAKHFDDHQCVSVSVCQYISDEILVF